MRTDPAFYRRLNTTYLPFCHIMEREEGGSFTFSAKDNLCTMDMPTRAGSRILEGYRPPFDATAVGRMRKAGGVLIGKTNMDEFGFGTFSTNSAYGVPRNPFDRERACGGSSGGAAVAAALIPEHVALGVSTGGSISCPASFCGVVGLTPTYGRVSRYGLIDYGNSLDKIGILSRSVESIQRFLPVISGPDPKDPTSCRQPSLDVDNHRSGPLAVPEQCFTGLSPSVSAGFQAALDRLQEQGWTWEKVDMPSLQFALPAYYVLATAEASTNLARYGGMLFGQRELDYQQHFNDYFTGVRSEGFGDEAKRRILLGTFCRMVGFRNKYYLKALSVREQVLKDYRSVLQDHGMVLSPTMPFVAPRFSDIGKMRPLEMYQADFLTVPPNLTGLPHISMPCGQEGGMPIGMQAVARHWDEATLLHFAEAWEKVSPCPCPEVVQ